MLLPEWSWWHQLELKPLVHKSAALRNSAPFSPCGYVVLLLINPLKIIMQVWNRSSRSSFQVEWELSPIQWCKSGVGIADWNNHLWISQAEIKGWFWINEVAGAKPFGVRALLVLQISRLSLNNQKEISKSLMWNSWFAVSSSRWAGWGGDPKGIKSKHESPKLFKSLPPQQSNLQLKFPWRQRHRMCF